MDDWKSRFNQTQPSGKVMQRDLRLSAEFEIIDLPNSVSRPDKTKFQWFFTQIPNHYNELLSEPALSAMRDCPEEFRSLLGKTQCKVALKINIGGENLQPVIGYAGFLVNDRHGVPSRCISIIDKNDLQTNIFW
jgi:hypothetical protein